MAQQPSQLRLPAASTNAKVSPPPPSSPDAAKLSVCILSCYDLPNRDPPSCVRITVGDGRVVKTGPPSQRHKDRNSFKFGATETVSIAGGSLAELYNSTAKIELVYPNSTKTLSADYALRQLKIHETVWLILQLQGGDGGVQETMIAANDEDEIVPPTLRLQMTLTGPYRPEIGTIILGMQHWFKVVDHVETLVSTHIASKLPAIDPKWIALPLVPLVATVVVASPVWMGIFAITLPISLPVTVLVAFGLSCVGMLFSALYASTRTGRDQVQKVANPVFHTLASTPLGQRSIYNTGPRPTPVSLAQWILPDGMWQRLLISLCIDGIGSGSYLLPLLGEGFDVVWAPLQTTLIMAMYNETSPNLKYVSALEELLPFTDIIPSATSGWLMQFGLPMLFPSDHQKSSSKSGFVNRNTNYKVYTQALVEPTEAPSSVAVTANSSS